MARPWRDEPLATRLYLEPHLWRLASFVGYDGKTAEEVEAFMEGHRARHGETKAAEALRELTAEDERAKRTVLSAAARRACRVLLGPPPDSPEHADFWSREVQLPGMAGPVKPRPKGLPRKGVRKKAPAPREAAGRGRKKPRRRPK